MLLRRSGCSDHSAARPKSRSGPFESVLISACACSLCEVRSPQCHCTRAFFFLLAGFFCAKMCMQASCMRGVQGQTTRTRIGTSLEETCPMGDVSHQKGRCDRTSKIWSSFWCPFPPPLPPPQPLKAHQPRCTHTHRQMPRQELWWRALAGDCCPISLTPLEETCVRGVGVFAQITVAIDALTFKEACFF